MKISSTLPILLLPFTLAHAHGIAPAHHPRRNGSLRNSNLDARFDKHLEGRQQSDGLLGGLVKVESTTSTTSTISTTIRTTSPVTSSSTILTTSSKDQDVDDDTSTLVTSRTTSSIGSTTSQTVSAVISSVVSGSTSASSSITPSANLTTSANSTSIVTSTVPETTSSSSASSAASVQYTTDAAGQTQLVTVILTAAASAADATSSAITSAKSKSDGDSIPVAAIIGISVGVGVVVLVLIAFAVWRMKKRTGDEDEAIRWPELNRHGDSDAHHALPARQTGQHGIETNPLSRSLSNSSSIFAPPSSHNHTHGNLGSQPMTTMTLNGSSFGASNSLEDEYSEKHLIIEGNEQSTHSHDDHDNYTSFPPPLQESNYQGNHLNHHLHDDLEEDENSYVGMNMLNDQHVTIPNHYNNGQSHSQIRPNFRLE
ncbi:uncharacterized protein I206_105438 [Kwoniella pini CBS 10737]|uniref:Mid2 domain-containing protein n=1 Tax=Kwoniella pini CBS 10737 TaxID=1296096 RepID=A0A1B9I491_9TREE|nr:uncharacterized protein I206_03656 [Kwoniella pini CBS 10737]OCF50337.1 hypothetical protein I206_03656 [Kwoniella pini CBS 10737]